MGALGAVVWAVREERAAYSGAVAVLRGLDAAACAPPSAETESGREGPGRFEPASPSAETVDGRDGRAPLEPDFASAAEPSAEPDSLASDAREERMDRVAVLYGEITAATREFLAALAESDRHRDWAEAGFGSCAEWLAWRIGITRNTANEKVRAARALEHLPLISDAMARGELSFTKVRAAYCTSLLCCGTR